MSQFTILNPKRQSIPSGSGLYSYYAGFSENFARSLIQSAALKKESIILDPWNGSGTTTTAALRAGIKSYGFDLNPVMVIIAKANLINPKSKTSLRPLAAEIIHRAGELDCDSQGDDEPLLAWFGPHSASDLRRIEQSIQCVLVEEQARHPLAKRCTFGGLSDLAAFYYTALFKTVKALLTCFSGTNPTWIKRPKTSAHRLRPTPRTVNETFSRSVDSMVKGLEGRVEAPGDPEVDAHIDVASSDFLPIADRCVDLVVTSPPYCTRIDYVIATSPELATLGYSQDMVSGTLRKKMIGTSTVMASVGRPAEEWGETCLQFLKSMMLHGSKASGTYYYKNHVQYFRAIYESLSELYRCTKKDGWCVIVVQDSFYKEIHNDLPRIIVEMAKSHRFELHLRKDFPFLRTMARIHPGVRKYRNGYGGIESVLCFRK